MNLPTIIIGLLVAAVFVGIILSEIRKKKKNKGSCSCGCSGCSMSDICHSNNEK